MVEISTISLRQLNRLVGVLHSWEEFERESDWRESVLGTLMGVLGARSGVFVATWDTPVVIRAERTDEGVRFTTEVDAPDPDHRWGDLLRSGLHGPATPDFREMVDRGSGEAGAEQDRRWEEFLGCVVFRRHQDGALSWIGTFDFEDPPAEVAHRSLPLLRILSPAFEAGVEGLRRGNRSERRLQGVVEAFGEPAMLLRPESTESRPNRAMQALLDHEPDSKQLLALFDELRGVGSPVTRRLGLARGEYAVDAGPLGPEGGMAARWTLVRVESSAPVLPGLAELRERFSLTDRESDVAIFLARGLSDKALAREFGVSWHTARRHVENTLKKLGVSSRARVMDRLLSRE